jgi:formylglycine-generating enzyme required for sulfatase activity/dienelactone hydrolase
MRLTRGALPITETIGILRDVARALAFAHAHGVVHRDIKPDNVMLAERHALIVDFGVAKAMSDARTTHALTSVGISVGTPAYMAPEQAAGDREADNRVDIYAAGITAYEMLTGRTPFSGSPQSVLGAHISQAPRPVTELRPDTPPALAAIVMRCLEKSPAARYQSAAELLGAIEALTTPSIGTESPMRALVATPGGRRRLTLVGVAVVLLIAGAAYALTARSRRARWVRTVGVPAVARLAEAGILDSAWTMANRVAAIAPHDSALDALWPRFSTKVVFRSEPSGASVYRTWYNDSTAWELVGTTPTDSVRVPNALTRYRIEKPGYRPVFAAHLPATSVLPQVMLTARPFILERSDAPNPEMVRIPGEPDAAAGVYGLGHETAVSLGDFFIDRNEVTNTQYKAFVDAGGYAKHEYWDQQFIKDGKPLSWEDGIRLFVDRTGRSGPSTWEAGAPPAGQEDFPVAGVSWYEASAYAKFSGKMLPTVFHWAQAATVNTAGSVVPHSNLQSRGLAAGSHFAGMGPYGTFDMAGNVREWCLNAVGDKRFILGGGWNDEPYTFTDAFAQEPFDRSPTNGIRLMKLIAAEPQLASTARPMKTAYRDYAKETPAPDLLFDTYRRMYDYDQAPLDAKLTSVDSTGADWTVERVSYAAAYGHERIPALLFLPKRHQSPYQVVVNFPGSYAISAQSSDDIIRRWMAGLDFIIRSGRAVLLPIYKSTYERNDSLSNDSPDLTNFYRDHVLMWGRDLRRSVDYLGKRPDIDTTKIAYYGLSWGAALGPIMLAIEPRFKTAVLFVAGLGMERGKPEVDPINFLPRVTVPVLMLNGKYDHFFPVETSQKPFYRLLGTPPDRKRYVVYEGGHSVPREKLISETLVWLDRYLGPVR